MNLYLTMGNMGLYIGPTYEVRGVDLDRTCLLYLTPVYLTTQLLTLVYLTTQLLTLIYLTTCFYCLYPPTYDSYIMYI